MGHGKRSKKVAPRHAGRTVLLAAVALVLWAPSAQALTDADELGRFGSEGTAAGQFSFPGSSAADPVTGHLYLVDGGNNRIDEFTPWGDFVKAFGWDVAPGAVNEQQEVRVRAGAGTFKLGFEGAETPSLPFDATAAEVQGALNALATIGGSGGSVSVQEALGNAATATPYLYVIAFKGSLAATNVAQLTAANGSTPLSGGNPATTLEAGTRAGGTAAGTGLESCTTESGCQKGSEGSGAGQFTDPGGIAVDAAGDLYLSEGQHPRVQKFSPAGHFLWTLGSDTITNGAAGTGVVTSGSKEVKAVVTTEKAFMVGQAIEGTGIEAGTTIAAVGSLGTITLSAPAGPSATGTTTALSVKAGPNNVPSNEKVTIALGANTTGGTFGLIFSTPEPSSSSATTAQIPAGATAGELQGTLEALSNIGPGDIAVTGPAGGPWTVEFKGPRYADTTLQPMTTAPLNNENLTVSSGQKEVSFTSAKGSELCHVATECQGGGRGNGPGEFEGFRGLAIAPDGSLLVADKRIQRFSAAGAYQATLESSVPIGGFAGDPTSGALYVSFSSEPSGLLPPNTVAKLDPATGKQVGTLTLERPRAFTTDPASNVFVVADQAVNTDKEWEEAGRKLYQRVIEFDAEGKRVSVFAESELVPGGGTNGEQHYNLSGLGTNSLGDLYATYQASSTFLGASLRFFGPPPASLESPPLAPPQITAQFATSVTTTEAALKAKIDPRFWNDTTYHLEYGTAPCSEGGCKETAGVRLTEEVKGNPLTTPAVSLEGLSPATVYHYRFVAKSTGGGPVFGPDKTFTTYRASEAESCPANEAFRVGPSATLPDCRAYEMVSPVDKEGGSVTVKDEPFTGLPATLDQSATSGNKLAYGSEDAFAGAKAGPYTNQYIAARGEAGWSTHPISPPQSAPILESPYSEDTLFKAFSGDLCGAWLRSSAEPTLAAGALSAYPNLYRRTDDECAGPAYEVLSTAKPPKVEPKAYYPLELQGLSADGQASAYLANDSLPGTGAPAQPEGCTAGGASCRTELYARDSSGTRFACVLPTGKASTLPCFAGGSGEADGRMRSASLQGALSTDGTKLFWGASKVEGEGPIYLRSNPTQPQSAFANGSASGQGKVTEGSTAVSSLIAARGKLALVKESTVATLLEQKIGQFAAGQAVTGTGLATATTVAKVEGTTVVLSKAATATAESTITSKGPLPFAVKQAITGTGIPKGTTITAVKEGELTLSAPATVTQAGTELEATSECSEPSKACTQAVSATAEAQSGAEGSLFLAAARDGSRALFTTGGIGATETGAAQLYEYRLADRSTHLIAAKVLGSLGASEDATRVYFASREALGGVNGEGKTAVAKDANLYLYEAGSESYRFIGVLANPDLIHNAGEEFSPLTPDPSHHIARVSPDAAHAAFVSTASLTGYDNADVATGEPDAEVYLYDAEGGGRLACASCNPSGARPQGRTVVEVNSSIRAAARIPSAYNVFTYSRPLSADGRRLFFNAQDALVPRDTNGRQDVYEWEAPGAGSCRESSPSYSPSNQGCIYLISSGQAALDSEFVDASPSGDDVFINTIASLVPQDVGLADIYDARVGGGLPVPPAPPPSCEGEACQGTPEAPNDPTPASESFEGAGNVRESPQVTPPAKCAKGKVRRHGKCVAKKRRKAHRRAKRNQRAGR
jgi:hypothetical protein